MNETWTTMFGTNSIAITAGELQIRPGLARHQLVLPMEVRPTAEEAHGHNVSFGGSVSAGSLRGGGGYLGRIHPTSPRQLFANGKLDEYLHFDIEPRQIAAIEALREAGFSLDVQLEISADAGTIHGSAHLTGVPVGRETWLQLLAQAQYQRTMILELPMPNPQSKPGMAKAVDFFTQAQRRFAEGENRLAVEAIRQSLAAIVNQDPSEEEKAAEVLDGMRIALKSEEGYVDRFELVRRSIKLLADLGAHPEVDETGPKEARAAIAMASGLLQWLTARGDSNS